MGHQAGRRNVLIGRPSLTSLLAIGRMMLNKPELPTTSVLFIDRSKEQRIYWADQLQRCSNYEIVEASDGQSGLDLYRSRRIDCLVLGLELPASVQILVELVPVASKPQLAIIVLTQIRDRGVWELVKGRGAYACLHKDHTTGDDLDKAIQEAVAFVKQMPKEDRERAD